MRKKNIIKFCLISALFSLYGSGIVRADTGSELPSLSRGEATDLVINFYDLEKKNSTFLTECKADLDTCMFTFSTKTNFDGLRTSPLILYPDVYPAYRFYKSINLASQLDLVRGYYQEDQSPFRPEQPISRVEALKLVMGASGMLSWKDKFEVSNEQDTWLKFSFDGDRWWYGRYIASAVQSGFLNEMTKEEAESQLSKEEFLKIMESANKIVAGGQTSSLADIYGHAFKKADASGDIAF
jgi:hypothetical protein